MPANVHSVIVDAVNGLKDGFIEQPDNSLSMINVPIAPSPEQFIGYNWGSAQVTVEYARKIGVAQLINGATPNVRIRADVETDTAEARVKQWQLDAGWHEMEMANERGRRLATLRVQAAVEGVMRAHDEFAFQGGSGASDSFARSTTVTQETDLSAKISDASTNAELLAAKVAVLGLINAVEERSEGAFRTTHVCAPIAPINKLADNALEGSSRSILEEIVSAKGVTFVKIPDLKNRADSGQDGRMVAFDAVTRDVAFNGLLLQDVSEPWQTGARQYEVAVDAATFGWLWTQPLAARYLDNVGS